MTEVERRLWYALRARRIDGFKFRRQRPIGPYIVDFVCLERGLVVELDGGQHAERVEYDGRRDSYLNRAGYAVLRFWNHEVSENIDGVMQAIDMALRTGSEPALRVTRTSPQAGDRRTIAKRTRMKSARAQARSQGFSSASGRAQGEGVPVDSNSLKE